MLKKYILFGLFLSCCAVSVAMSELCMTNYSVLIVLDKDLAGTVKYGAPQIDGMNWRVDVNYDTLATYNGVQRYIRGAASCSEFPGDGNVGYVDTDTAALAGDVSGMNCWCVMARPATTYPMLAYVYNDVDSCVANCAALCADKIISSSDFRDKFFEAVW